MDRVLPGIGGDEATRLLRREFVEGLTIIGISASSFEEERRTFLEAGLDAFLPKPFPIEELLVLLEEHAGLVFEGEVPAEVDASAGRWNPNLLPGSWVEALRRAVRDGAVTRIRKLADEIESLDPRLAARLRAAAYDLKGLESLFED